MYDTLLDADIEEYERDNIANQRSLEFMMKHPHLDRVLDVFRQIRFYSLYTICKVKGHDLVDNGYATPDSGCIQMDCKRCGYSYPTHWLY